MNDFWLGFIIGVFVGANIGVLMAGLLAGAKRSETEMVVEINDNKPNR